jgi:hypothetical protein
MSIFCPCLWRVQTWPHLFQTFIEILCLFALPLCCEPTETPAEVGFISVLHAWIKEATNLQTFSASRTRKFKTAKARAYHRPFAHETTVMAYTRLDRPLTRKAAMNTQDFTNFLWNLKIYTIMTRTLHWSLVWARWIQLMQPYLISIR